MDGNTYLSFYKKVSLFQKAGKQCLINRLKQSGPQFLVQFHSGIHYNGAYLIFIHHSVLHVLVRQHIFFSHKATKITELLCPLSVLFVSSVSS